MGTLVVRSPDGAVLWQGFRDLDHLVATIYALAEVVPPGSTWYCEP